MSEQGDLLEYLLALDEYREAQRPADPPEEELELIGPHLWHRGVWRPVEDVVPGDGWPL